MQEVRRAVSMGTQEKKEHFWAIYSPMHLNESDSDRWGGV